MPNLREETYLLISYRTWCYLFLLSQAGVWVIGAFVVSDGGFEATARVFAGSGLETVVVRVLKIIVFLIFVVAVFSIIAMVVIIWEFILERIR